MLKGTIYRNVEKIAKWCEIIWKSTRKLAIYEMYSIIKGQFYKRKSLKAENVKKATFSGINRCKNGAIILNKCWQIRNIQKCEIIIKGKT